jgi:hypothetical protein
MVAVRSPRRIGNPISRLRHGLALVALMVCAGCASTPEASSERDAQAKRFEPVTRDAVVYVYRPDHWSFAADTTLWADGRLIGASVPQTYFRFTVLPGRTVLHTSGPDTGRIEITTRGNDIVYVEMQTADPITPTSVLRVVPAEKAQAQIRECCTMLEVWRPGQPRLFW